LAWAGLADAYHILSGWGWYIPKEEGETLAKQFAIKALEKDPNLAEAHATLGFILCYIEWEWEKAEEELMEAIRLNPNYAFARQIYSQLSDIKGNSEKARNQIDIALELDPLSPIIHYISATLHYNEGNFSESLNECEEIQLLEENFTSIHWWFFKNYYRLGDGENALNELKIIFEQDTLTQNYSEQAGTIYAEKGLDGLIELLLNVTELEINNNPSNINHLYWKGYLSELYAIAGNKDKALEWIEYNMENNTEGDRFIRLINNYDYSVIQKEERFKEIVDTLGLTEYYTKIISR
jgi:tetratricopeptide (TPR) repeat protein